VTARALVVPRNDFHPRWQSDAANWPKVILKSYLRTTLRKRLRVDSEWRSAEEGISCESFAENAAHKSPVRVISTFLRCARRDEALDLFHLPRTELSRDSPQIFRGVAVVTCLGAAVTAPFGQVQSRPRIVAR
jgi:hypothetical protein